MRRNLGVVSLLFVLSVPCYAIKSMMFNGPDQYIESAQGIWIVEVVGQRAQEGDHEAGPVYEAKVIQTLKGNAQKNPLALCTVFKPLTAGGRYLVFGFNKVSDDGPWLDNGNVSPVQIPASMALSELEGKSLKEQVSRIVSARCQEIERLVNQLNGEKKALEEGMDFQKRRDVLPGKGE